MRDNERMFAMRRNVVVAASAGTGKTFHLVGVLVHLLMGTSELGTKGEPMDPSRIVATTFSRKAAAEIRERLVVELDKLASDPASSGYRASLPIENPRHLASRAREALAAAERVSITTLHGLAHRIARSHALELGYGADFTVAEDEEANRIARDAVVDAASRFADVNPRGIELLLSLFRGADRLVDGVLRVLSDLEEMGAAASSILLPEGDREALEEEMRDVIENARLLSSDAAYAAHARALLRAWDEGNTDEMIRALTPLFAMRRSQAAPRAAHAIWDKRDALPDATNATRAASLIARWACREHASVTVEALRDLVVASDSGAREAFLRARVMSFGGVLRAARDLLLDHPGVAKDFGADTDVLLIDELQDTSRIQRDLLLLLWQRDPAGRRPGAMPSPQDVRSTGLFVVGDRKQSIYAFRGADVGVFTDLCVSLAGEPARAALRVAPRTVVVPLHPSADFFALRENYRSAPGLLAFANAFASVRLRAAAPAIDEIDFSEATEGLLVPRSREASAVTSLAWWIRPRSSASKKTTRIDDANVIARTVLAVASKEGRPFRDFAVLAFSNEMLDATAHALARANVPYVAAGRGFYETSEVRDLTAMLRTLVSPSDRRALLSVLRGPWAGVSDQTLVGLTEAHRGVVCDLERWGQSERRALIEARDSPALERLRRVLVELRRALHRLGPGGALRAAIVALGLEEALVVMPRGEQRVANVRKFVAIADRERDTRSLLRRIDRAEGLSREAEAAVFSDDDDAVRLLTIHGSKGLDFRVVIIPEVGSHALSHANLPLRLTSTLGSPPTLSCKVMGRDDRPHDVPSFRLASNEERRRNTAERHRLLYVAVTRASERMYFVGAGKAEVSLAATLETLARDPRAELRLEEASEAPPAPSSTPTATSRHIDLPSAALHPPVARHLGVAVTALRDFDACPRRFELLHELGVPEPRGPSVASREEGAIVHRVLERVAVSAFGSASGSAMVAVLVDQEAFWMTHEGKRSLVDRAARFLSSAYAHKVAAEGGTVRREQPFVFSVGTSPTVSVRGTMDLVVSWPNGKVDVLDYKGKSLGRPSDHAIQLDSYGLAAESAFPGTKVRVGVVPLGDEKAEPRFRSAHASEAVRTKLGEVGRRLALARAESEYPKVAVDRCRSLGCGFIALCHSKQETRQMALFG